MSEPRNLLAELDSIKAHVETTVGKKEAAQPGNIVSPLSRFEERFVAFRNELESVLQGVEVFSHYDGPNGVGAPVSVTDGKEA